nr:SpaH/EbpB family LPXTG-anchored major pilin [uncultured Mediterraneibacter sp.]
MLAGVLSAAMVLSTMTVTAFAADTKMPTIDTNNKGSITINKYEGNDTTKPLAGVEFTIYKIANLKQGNNPVELKYKSLIGDDVTITSDTKYDDIKSVVDAKVADGSLTGTSKTTEMKNGKATAEFTNLDLGVYLVEETKAPSQVVNKTANFLVSVPMTNKAGDDWVYDITADPKNETVYGGITLIKKGKTIKVNGSETEENLKNVSFELQKKETTGWTKVNEYTTNESGLINVTGLAPATYRFIETNLGGKDDNKGYILDGKTAYEFTVQTDGKIKVGTTEASESATITVYNEKPSLEKSVKNAENSYDNDTDASVGDTVTWKVEASVPSNVNELKTYKLTDTMSDALTWEVANANLQISTSPNTELIQSKDYNLTVPTDNIAGGKWTIEFTEAGKIKLADNNVKVITVTFNTKLNENAKIGSEGNLNDAELDYSNAIYPTEDPDNPNKDNTPGEDIIKDQAIVYSFQMNIEKVDGKDSTIKLQGVTFDLYSYTGTKTNPTEADLKGSDGVLVEQNLTTDADGKIQKSGLKNGTYYLVETKTVKTKDGKQYNLLKEPVKVEIKVDYVTKTETTITKDGNGNVTDTTTVSTKTFTGGDNGSEGTFTVTVKNYTGFDLPTTGGMGTVLFSIAGFALMAGAAFVLLKGRRKDA